MPLPVPFAYIKDSHAFSWAELSWPRLFRRTAATICCTHSSWSTPIPSRVSFYLQRRRKWEIIGSVYRCVCRAMFCCNFYFRLEFFFSVQSLCCTFWCVSLLSLLRAASAYLANLVNLISITWKCLTHFIGLFSLCQNTLSPLAWPNPMVLIIKVESSSAPGCVESSLSLKSDP